MAAIAVGHPVPDAVLDVRVKLYDSQDSCGAATLRELHGGRATLLVFLRHFGCIGCETHVAELVPILHDLQSLGVRVVFVGNGDPRYLPGFVARHGLLDKEVILATDPARLAYRAAGFSRSVVASFGPAAFWGELMAVGRGFRGHGVEGDVMQQGGSLLLDASARVALYHRARHQTDHARAADLVARASTLLVDREVSDGRPLL